jgi:hypothetical protein
MLLLEDHHYEMVSDTDRGGRGGSLGGLASRLGYGHDDS